MAQEPRPVSINLSISTPSPPSLTYPPTTHFCSPSVPGPAYPRYTVAEIDTYPTVTNAVTIATTLGYGWASDALQVRAPVVYASLAVCFFAAVNLAVWDGVPFGLKWASYYLTGCVYSSRQPSP